ncbi:MAG: dihydropteroate synthase-like protein [Promethearchaeia archaeon]
MKILIITGKNSYPILERIIEGIKNHEFDIIKAPISISAFLTESMTKKLLNSVDLSNYQIVLLPGFVQWDTTNLEKQFSIKIRKGPEFASDLPAIMENIEEIKLSTSIPANELFKASGEESFKNLTRKIKLEAKSKISEHIFYINENRSDILIGIGLIPPIIAEIVNCTEKNDDNILKKVKHYIESGADIIDIGCVSNKPHPERIPEIIKLIRNHFNTLISIDSMNPIEIRAAVENGIDLILSIDYGNYQDLKDIPKDIPIVILPTNIKEGYFPREPEIRIERLFKLTKILSNLGFKKIIVDPLLETPITPGIVNSLKAYILYKEKANIKKYKQFERPLFFGISNVVELMDVDSVGINGLLASIAAELEVGILFTVEHSIKLIGGVAELKKSVKLNYLAKYKKTPPINQGIELFKAKGKISIDKPRINEQGAIIAKSLNEQYKADERGYFKIYTDLYSKQIYVLFYNNKNKLLNTFIGSNAEAICKKIIQSHLTENLYHINYLGRELKKAEIYLNMGKPYIQDD